MGGYNSTIQLTFITIPLISKINRGFNSVFKEPKTSIKFLEKNHSDSKSDNK